MRRLITAATLAIILSALTMGQTAGVGTAPSGEAEQAVLRLTKEWVEAEAKRDRAALERIVAADFEGTAPGGNRVTKSDIIPSAGAGGGGLSISLDDLKARAFGEAAVVTGRGLHKGREGVEVRVTLVYAKRQGSWQMVTGHLSAVAPE